MAILIGFVMLALGWTVTRLLLHVPQAIADTVTNVDLILRDDTWHQFIDTIIERVRADLGGALGGVDLRTFAMWPTCAIIVAALMGGVLLLGRLPPVLVTDRDHLTSRTHRPDALDTWLMFLRTLTRRAGMPLRVQVRRLMAERWALAQRFWLIILPTGEATFFLGGGAVLAATAASTEAALLMLITAATVAAHNQATEARAALAPVLGLAAERHVIVLYLQAPPGSMRALFRARRVLLAAHVLPAAGITLIGLGGYASAIGLPWLLVLLLVASILVVNAVAPIVQWFMGPLLIPDAMNERTFEQGTGSAAETVQSTLQALPRYPLVVAPLLASAFVAMAGDLIPPAIPLSLSLAILVTHVIAAPLLLFAERSWVGNSYRSARDSWRVR
ncbi:hypothetical protein [Microbacterium sp.]|uniref:hypothetical protein n=1 Tax=Microbacterium sp. TaxID=51671 RepID=UPI003A8A888B